MNIRHLPLLSICILGTITASISHASEVDKWEMYAPVGFTDIGVYNGRLFITTSRTGIIIYDPASDEFQQLTKINSKLHSNFHSKLLVDSQNRLWVGTYDNGVAMLQNGNWTIYDTTTTPFRNGIWNIKEGLNGSIWFLKYNQVIEFQNDEWILHDSLLLNSPLDHFYDITFDSSGGIWVYGDSIYYIGDLMRYEYLLGQYNGSKWRIYTEHDLGHYFGHIKKIQYSGNKLWVLTYNYGVSTLEDSIWTQYSHYPDQVLLGPDYRDMILTSDSTCWVLCSSGFSYFDGYSWINYPFEEYDSTYANLDPYKIKVAENGVLYGFINSGFWRNSIFTFDTHNLEIKAPYFADHIYDSGIWAINFENANTTWVSTYNGLYSYTNGEWDVYKYNGYGQIRPNAIDHNGIVWIGTHYDGVHALDRSTSTWSHYTTETSELPADPIRAIAIDSQNRKWIGTWGGGFVIFDDEENTWEIFNTENSSLLDNDVTLIFIEEDETTWIGTYGGGISRIIQNEWTNYTTSNSLLPSNNIVAINQNPDGSMWVGTNGKGLIRIEGEEMTIFDKSNSGIPDDHVGGIAFDSEGKVWVSTYEGGIASFDGTNWNVFNTLNSPLSTDYIWCLNIDSDDTKWIGTWGGGLFLYNENGISEIDINEVQNHISKSISISNYPNPFNTTTTISFTIPSSGGTSIEVFDLRGKLVKTLLNKELRKGSYEIQFNADKLSSGIYICKISTQSSHIRHHNTRKLLLIK
ncbi:MAG: hypothetical protein DRP89_00155 [Candidatus Neomarinimicrobiota bacterium]|nr:MAG: hypothetical protein DRP89_00155 [Candidatus Neomarinimicrobiota bacterium]